jgi:hypothetical protein
MAEDHDPDFEEVVYDADGRASYRRRMTIIKKDPNNNSNWVTYDTSHGHCALCGSLGCHGYCFK